MEKENTIQHNTKLKNLARAAIITIHFYYLGVQIKTYGICIQLLFFITNISFYMNISYYIVTLLNNTLSKNKPIFTKSILNSWFRLAFTLSISVIILYWGIYMKKPSLLGSANTPFHMELFFHGGNLLVLIIDRLVLDRANRDENRITAKFLFVFSIIYFVWLYFLYYTFGIAIYPLIAKLTFPQYLILGIVGYSLFVTGNTIYQFIM